MTKMTGPSAAMDMNEVLDSLVRVLNDAAALSAEVDNAVSDMIERLPKLMPEDVTSLQNVDRLRQELTCLHRIVQCLVEAGPAGGIDRATLLGTIHLHHIKSVFEDRTPRTCRSA